MVSGVGALTLLFVPLAEPIHRLHAYDCLQQSYYGIYGGRHAFILDDPCWTSSFSLLGLGTPIRLELEVAEETRGGPPYVFDTNAVDSDPNVQARDPAGAEHFIPVLGVKGHPPVAPPASQSPSYSRDLVWLERTRVDRALYDAPFELELDWVLGNLSMADPRLASTPDWETQLAFDTPPATARPFEALCHAQDGVLLSVSRARLGGASSSALAALDGGELALPRFWRYSVFPKAPIQLSPVPDEAKERLRAVLPSIKFDHVVASIVNGISVNHLRSDIRHLTGEATSSDIETRHSFSMGVRHAAFWLKEQLEQTGAQCELKQFRKHWAPNVVCTYSASTDTTETIILGAHYDDRGSFGSTLAPGANDDGSGTGALLGIARAIARRNVVFRKNVQLVAFAGEEQGMVGSFVYARELREAGANVTMMIQGDMLAYHAEGEPPELGLSDPALVGTAEVTEILERVSAIYSPELKVGYFPYAGGSDHQRFHEHGFPAAQVNERIGLIKDPMYHDSGDVSGREGYDFEQIKSIAMVELAAVLHVAGFDLSGVEVGHEGGEDS